MLRILIYHVPSRTFPMHLMPYSGGRIKVASPVISVNRSPHIDKRAQEQFQATMLKKPICLQASNMLKTKLQAGFSRFQNFFAPLRINMTITKNKRFRTNF